MFINVRMTKVFIRKHARSEALLGEICAIICTCNRSCDMSYFLVRSVSNKRWWCTMKRQMKHTRSIRVMRWSDDGTCINAIGRTAKVRSCKPSRMSLVLVVCGLIFSICTIWWGGIGTAASMVLSWKSILVWKIACLYGVYILVGKWRATAVQRCIITCGMSYNTLMVVQHTHTKVWVILRP